MSRIIIIMSRIAHESRVFNLDPLQSKTVEDPDIIYSYEIACNFYSTAYQLCFV